MIGVVFKSVFPADHIENLVTASRTLKTPLKSANLNKAFWSNEVKKCLNNTKLSPFSKLRASQEFHLNVQEEQSLNPFCLYTLRRLWNSHSPLYYYEVKPIYLPCSVITCNQWTYRVYLCTVSPRASPFTFLLSRRESVNVRLVDGSWRFLFLCGCSGGGGGGGSSWCSCFRHGIVTALLLFLLLFAFILCIRSYLYLFSAFVHSCLSIYLFVFYRL